MSAPTTVTMAFALALTGCGAEVASTAVTTTQLHATQAQQAMAQGEQVKKSIDDALRKAADAASAAAEK
jgi:hypothetical protein